MPRKNHKAKQSKPEALKIPGIPAYKPKLQVAEDVVPRVVHHLPEEEKYTGGKSDIRTRKKAWG